MASNARAKDDRCSTTIEDNRRDFLKCMAWAGTGALFAFDGGVASSIGLDARSPRRSSGRGRQAFHLRPAERQPYRLQQAAQCRRPGDLPRGDREGQSAAGPARFHHPHRRRLAALAGRGVRRRRADAQGNRAASILRSRASTTCSIPTAARRSSNRFGKGTQGCRLVQFRPSRRALRRAGQCRRPEARRDGQPWRRAAQLAQGRSCRPPLVARRSSSSRISRCGRSMPIGAGAPTMPPKR